MTAASRRGRAVADADPVAVDITTPGSLAAALAGHDALACHLPFVHDIDRARALGEAIAGAVRAASVPRVVFNTSCIVADHDLGLGAHDGRRAIEAALADSGAAFGSIRPTAFMDNLIRPWVKPTIVRDGVFAYPASSSLLMSWVCIDDVARAMVAMLARDDLAGARIAIGGPEALLGDEVAARLTTATGRRVRFVGLDPQDFAAAMAERVTGSRTVPDGSVYHGMARFYAWYNAQARSPLVVRGDPPGVVTTSFAEWAQRQDWTA